MKTSRVSNPRPKTLLFRFTLLTLGACCAFATASLWVNQLAFDPEAISRGEIWRLLTGYFAHLNWFHATANALGLGIAVAVLGELISLRIFLGSALFIALGTDAIFMLPSFQFAGGFVGFSGILYGFAALIAILLIGKATGWAAGIVVAIVISVAASSFGFSPWAFETATGTHIAGLVLGGLSGVWIRLA